MTALLLEAAMPTILCIDDRKEALNIRKQMLEMKGYSVLIVDNGASGLRVLSDNRVDAVILDYKMEGMDGFAVATAIRKRHGDVPIVLPSGYASLPKPLLQMVDASLAKGKPRADAFQATGLSAACEIAIFMNFFRNSLSELLCAPISNRRTAGEI